MKKLVKPLKINRFDGKIEIHEKTRQNAENKQIFDLTVKIE